MNYHDTFFQNQIQNINHISFKIYSSLTFYLFVTVGDAWLLSYKNITIEYGIYDPGSYDNKLAK